MLNEVVVTAVFTPTMVEYRSKSFMTFETIMLTTVQNIYFLLRDCSGHYVELNQLHASEVDV